MDLVRQTLRGLIRSPRWSGLVILTLGVGIGTTTAVFGVVDALLLQPLPYANAARLKEIRTMTLQGRRLPGLGAPTFRALRDEAQDFAAIEGYEFGAATLTGDGEPALVSAPNVTPGLLPLLGIRPLAGRLFTNEDVGGAQKSALISERLWTQRFARSRDAIGRRIAIDDETHTIIGVVPTRGSFPEQRVDVWRVSGADSNRGNVGRLQTIAGTRSDMTQAAFDERLSVVVSRLHEQSVLPRDQRLHSDELIQQRWGRRYSAALYAMLGAVALVLLVACVNATNLMLIRAATRQGEFALMDALGAPRSRIVAHVTIETIVLAVSGGVAGIAVAHALLTALLAQAPPEMTLMTSVSTLNARALLVAMLLSTTVCVVVAVLPALRASRIGAIDRLRTRVLGSQDRRDDVWQSFLVAGQLALVLVLLTGTGLLLRSFVRLINVDPGFASDNLMVFEMQPAGSRYAKPRAAFELFQQLDENIERRFGSGSATFAIGAPPRSGGFSFGIHPEAEGGARFDPDDLELPHNAVAPDYFSVLGIRFLQGRTFAPDDPDAVVIVNDVVARRFWGDASPLGRRFRMDAQEPWLTVVGVVSDVKTTGLADTEGEGMEIYFPYQRESPFAAFFTVIVRASGAEIAIAQDVKRELWKLDPSLPVVEAASMRSRLGDSVAHPRFLVGLASAFAGVAVLLAAVGVYGTAAYWVARRRRDLGIRMALGATRDAVLRLVLARGLRLAMWGGLAGILASLAATRTISATLLFETSPRDPSVLIAAVTALIVLALIACMLPALHAAKLDPAKVLRTE